MLKQLLQLDALSRWHPLLEDVSRQLRSSTVNAIFGSPVTAEECLALDPDAVVVATGGRPSAPSADGYGSWHTDLDVLTGRYSPDPAAHVVVACGTETHQGPLAIADHLAQRVSKVTLLTELRAVGQSVEPRSLNRWLERLTRSGVKVVPMQRVTQLTGKTVLTSHTYGGPAGAFLADDVIWAGPRVADDSLAASLARERPALPLVVLGDALAPRRITHAVLEGARAGRAL